MWLITTSGFYSVVEKPWDKKGGTLTVRARAKSDLEALRAEGLPELSEVSESDTADYRFRAQAPRAAVARAIMHQVEKIDYDNFKSAVGRRQGPGRERIYHRTWDALNEIQRERARP